MLQVLPSLLLTDIYLQLLSTLQNAHVTGNPPCNPQCVADFVCPFLVVDIVMIFAVPVELESP